MNSPDMKELRRTVNRLIRDGNLDEAQRACSELCRLAPEDGRARYWLGVISSRLGRLEEAVEHFERAAGLQADIPGLHASYGSALLALGRDEAAFRQLEQAVAQDGTDYHSLNNLATLHLKRGDRARAEAGYRCAIELSPRFNDAACNLAGLLQNNGRGSEAVTLCGKILARNPGHRQAFLLLCNAMLDSRVLDEALGIAASAAPHFVTAEQFYYGIARKLHGMEHFSDAGKVLQAALALFPGRPLMTTLLASCLAKTDRKDEAATLLEGFETGDLDAEQLVLVADAWNRLQQHDRAEDCLRRSLSLDPDSIAGGIGLATIASARGDSDAAIAQLARLQGQHPDNVDILLAIGALNFQNGLHAQAIDAYRKAIALQPDNAIAHNDLGKVLQQFNRRPEAMSSYQQAIELDPDLLQARCHLASLHLDMHEGEEALARYEAILETKPEYEMAISGKAACLERLGRSEEAFATVSPLVESGYRQVQTLINYAMTCPRGEQEDHAIELLREALETPRIYRHIRMQICFILGKLHDRRGEYDDAFGYYKAGNDLSTERFNQEAFKQSIQYLKTAFSAAQLESLPVSTIDTARPVFIVGMPRSGTSMVEQILASHPSVYGGGELPYVMRLVLKIREASGSDKPFPFNLDSLTPEILDQLAGHYLQETDTLANGEPYITDKMPSNFLSLGLIQMLFPDAHVIHCNRNPVDVCLSCYFQHFTRGQNFSYQLQDITTYYNGYRDLMAHWKSVLKIPVLDMVYEDLIAAPEPHSRALLEFIGLDWDPACLEFHKSDRVVHTASYKQVRQPVYQTSAGRWKRYEKHLGELLETLDEGRPSGS